MKHNALLFTAFVMISLLWACSQQEEIMETVAAAKGTTTIVASTGNAAGTRIAFTDEGADGVKQAWEAGDQFLLYDDNGNYAATLTIKEGEAGKRYTAELTGFNKLQKITAFTLATLTDIPNNLNTWVITDAITAENNLSALRSKINAAGKNITLVLPNATGIGEDAFIDCTNLTAVNLPKATFLGSWVFEGCTALQSLEIATGSTGLSSVGIDLFNSVTLSNVNLTVGEVERSQVNADDIKWRGYGPFRSITIR